MATTDTRTGFRLPWSSDRNQEAAAAEEAAPAATETTEDAAPEVHAAMPSDRPGDPGEPIQDAPDPDPSTAFDPSTAPDPSTATATDTPQEPAMIAFDPSPAPAPVAPRKPSKLMVDLGAAIRATAEAARDQALAQVDADLAHVVEAIRSGSKEGEAVLRVRSDEDIAQIREWSRAEIARIKEETERRIAARKSGLDEELAAHSAAIEQRVGQVEGTATAYRTAVSAYADSLGSEDDPSRLATLAESMPEPPDLEAWADLTDLSLDPAPVEAVEAVEAVIEPVEIAPEGHVADDDAPYVEAVAAPIDVVEPAEATVEPAEAVVEAVEENEPAEIPFENIVAALGGDPSLPDAQPVTDEPHPTADQHEIAAETTAPAAAPTWGDSPELTVSDLPRDSFNSDQDDAPAADDPAFDPYNRAALFAALEADAETVVSTEATAGVAETDDEPLADRVDAGDGMDPAAMPSGRMEPGGFGESFADRMAFLTPSRDDADVDSEPRTTQVIVSGLVSVASIASFKRHLGRLPGVRGVAVASGPAGEFVFNVTHQPDVSFRDAVPTMPGFAARVTSTADGLVHVTARDPEAEG
jgi:hypothetical protein